MNTRCGPYFIAIYFIILVHTVQIDSLKWDLSSTPIIFGEDVQLFCNGNVCKPKVTKKWIGGPSYKLLCFGNHCTNSSKYEMMTVGTSADFGLMIKHITIDDTFYKYTCACGLHQFTATLESVDYIYPPDVNFITIKERDGKYQIQLQMNVYPLPKCNITHEDQVLPVSIVNMSNMHSYREGKLLLYNVSVNHQMNVETKGCKKTIRLICIIGKRTSITIIQQSEDLCKEKQNSEAIFRIVSIVLVVAILLGLGSCIGYNYKSKLDQKINYCFQTGSDNHYLESQAMNSNVIEYR